MRGGKEKKIRKEEKEKEIRQIKTLYHQNLLHINICFVSFVYSYEKKEKKIRLRNKQPKK